MGSLLSVDKHMPLNLHLEVRGSEGITFINGGMTKEMTEEGITIKTVWYAEDGRSYGGCITKEEAIQLRDFLNTCISSWNIIEEV